MSITYLGNTTNMSYHLGKNHPLSHRALGLGSSKSGNDCGNPNLPKQLVKKYFSLTGTSVPSERLFSTAGNVISSKRNCLTPENADKLIFLFENDDIDIPVQ